MGNYKLKEASVLIVLLLLALSSIGNGMGNMDNNRDEPVFLYEDWNLIGWNYPYNTTASSLAENISNCISVSRWNASLQTYDTYIVGGPPTFDFVVEPAMGLFVDVNQDSSWYPFGYTIDGHSLDAADGDPVDVVYVNDDGNVGINTTNPEANLELTGEATLQISLINQKIGLHSGGPYQEFRFYKDDVNDPDYYNDPDSAALMTIKYNGSVGIGTTSPSEKLEVNGSIEVNGTVSASNFVGNGSGLNNINIGPEIHEIYSGSDFDTYFSGDGYTINSYEFSAITPQDIGSYEYIKINIFGTGFASSGDTHHASVYLKAQIKELGGSYVDIIPYKYYLTGDDNTKTRVSANFPILHILTLGEKTNGFQIKVFSESYANNGAASFTNINTWIEFW